MPLGVLIQRRKHDGQDDFDIVANEIAEILVVPEVEGSFSDLMMSVRRVEEFQG